MPLFSQQHVMTQDRATSQPASPPEAEAPPKASAAAMPGGAAEAPRPNIVTSWARKMTGDVSAAGVAPKHGEAARATAASAAPWPAPSAAQLRKVCPSLCGHPGVRPA